MDNLKIYNAVRQVPPEAKKEIKAGRLAGMTDINPMWRIKKLTELFGPCGIGWWYEITEKRFEADANTNQVAAFVDILLYYKDPETGETSHGIPGTGGSNFVASQRQGFYMSDECYKMALTDAIGVAAKALGIGADVYWEADRDKYTAAPPKEPEAPKKAAYEDKPVEGTEYKCGICGATLVPYKDAQGRYVSLRAHAMRSEQKYGQVLCLDCIRKHYPTPAKE